MGKIESYEDLEVWQLGITIVEEVYRVTAEYPDTERFGLTSQLRRAAVSIPSNIAEGWGRGRGKDFRRFLLMARSSLYEVKTQLLISNRVGYLATTRHSELSNQLDQLSKMLHGLIRSISDASR